MQAERDDRHEPTRRNTQKEEFERNSPLHENLTQRPSLNLNASLVYVPAREVLDTLDAIHAGESINIAANTRVELEVCGLLESISENEYTRLSFATSDFLNVAEDYAQKEALKESLETIVTEASRNLQSPWYKFWSLSWLGSGRLERDRRNLEDAETRLPSAQREYEKVAAIFNRLSELHERQSSYTPSNEGYLRLTEEGEKHLEQLKQYEDVASAITYGNLKTSIIACKQSMTRYTELLEHDELYDYDHVPALLPLAIYGPGTMEDLMDDYKALKEYDDLYDYQHIPGLLNAKLISNKPIGEIMRLYTQLMNHDEIYDYDYIPSLISTHCLTGKSLHELMTQFENFKAEEDLYSYDNIPVMIATVNRFQISLQDVMELYREFLKSEELYDYDHIPALLITAVRAKVSPDDVMEVYERFKGMSELYSYEHLPSLVSTAFRTGQSPEVIMGHYRHVMEDSDLYDYDHIPGIIATALGVLSVTQLNDIHDLDILDSRDIFESTFDSGTSFDTSWALAGDLLDNGSLDLSGGFFAGGLMGGLFD